jgi:hypothetical protein
LAVDPCLLLLVFLQAHGQAGLWGSYTVDTERSDDVQRVINAATVDMNFIVRPIARKRLRNANPPSKSVSIKSLGDSIEVVVNGNVILRSKPDGRPMDWRYDGDDYEVETLLSDSVLTQTFVGDDGRRVNHYRLQPDGTLLLEVLLTSPQLRRPVEYRVVYVRSVALRPTERL